MSSANMTSVSMSTTGNNFTAVCLISSDAFLSTTVSTIFSVFTAAVTLFTVCGNLLVIICVSFFKQLHTPTNILILSLAFSDFLVGLFVMPVTFILILETCWVFGAVMCVVFYFASFQLTCQSVHNVALLALDRYIALSNPFFYLRKVTLNVSIGAASLSWLFSIIYNFALLYSVDVLSESSCIEESGNLFSKEGWTFFDMAVVFILPCSLMIVLYCKIFSIAKRHSNEIGKMNNMQPKVKNCEHGEKSEKKAAKTIGILMIIFLLCLVPYYLSCSLEGIVTDETMYKLLSSTSILFCLNSFFNPIIYALFYPWFKKSIQLLFTFNGFTMDSNVLE